MVTVSMQGYLVQWACFSGIRILRLEDKSEWFLPSAINSLLKLLYEFYAFSDIEMENFFYTDST